jgi:hypothetical protein
LRFWKINIEEICVSLTNLGWLKFHRGILGEFHWVVFLIAPGAAKPLENSPRTVDQNGPTIRR